MGRRVEAQLELDPRVDPLAAWPFPDRVGYFMSGSNHAAEIKALFERGQNVGVAVPHLSESALTVIERDMRWGTVGVFVDSGAFSEVTFGPAGPRWPTPISEEQWRARLAKYLRIAKALRERAYLVAPDRVADQGGTLERLRTFGTQVAVCAAYGAQILVPVQKGRIPMGQFYLMEREILEDAGCPPWLLYPAIPLKKDATSLADMRNFLRTACKERRWRDHISGKTHAEAPRVHFLGRGIYSPDYRDTYAAALKACPDLEITSDSVRIRALVGRGKTLGLITAAQDALRAAGLTDGFEIKRQALHMALDAEDRRQLIEAVEAGWFDSELFDSAEEHMAWLLGARED